MSEVGIEESTHWDSKEFKPFTSHYYESPMIFLEKEMYYCLRMYHYVIWTTVLVPSCIWWHRTLARNCLAEGNGLWHQVVGLWLRIPGHRPERLRGRLLGMGLPALVDSCSVWLAMLPGLSQPLLSHSSGHVLATQTSPDTILSGQRLTLPLV